MTLYDVLLSKITEIPSKIIWKKFWKCNLSIENDENMDAYKYDSWLKDHEGLDNALKKIQLFQSKSTVPRFLLVL